MGTLVVNARAPFPAIQHGPLNGQLKERLHILITGTFIFEISTLYSSKANLIIVGKETSKNYLNMPKLSIV